MTKKFSRHRTHEEIKALCKKQRVPINDDNFQLHGWDSVLIGTKEQGFVIYNTFNGRFFGKTDRGVDFDSSSPKHDKAAWMQALLNFFYVE